jgi:hypothetical protein
MDEFFVASDVFRQRVGTDLDTSSTYRAIGRVEDDHGVDSGWQAGPEFTQSLTAPAAPTITFDPDTANGIMNVEVDAAFNLADPESSGFHTGLGKWENQTNSFLEWVDGEGMVTVIGTTYDDEDTTHTTYDAEDTAHTTYEVQRTTQDNDPGTSKIRYDGTYETWIPTTASQDYSSIISVKPIGKAVDVRIEMEQFTSGGASAGSTHLGAWKTCPPDVWTEVPSGAMTVSGTAAYIRPVVNFGGSGATNLVDDVFMIDNFAIARSDEVFWTPGGLTDLKFNVSRKIGDGDWEYVWNASRENPALPADVSFTVGTIPDRGYPLGTEVTVQYRAVVVTESTGKTIASALAEETAPALTAAGWWLRCVDGSVADLRLRAMDFKYSKGVSNEVLRLQGRNYATILETGDAPPQNVDIRAWLFSKDEFDTAQTILAAGTRLYVQRNVGDGFYIWVTGVSRYSQKRAVGGLSNGPRHLHRVDFKAEVVGPPEDVVQ